MNKTMKPMMFSQLVTGLIGKVCKFLDFIEYSLSSVKILKFLILQYYHFAIDVSDELSTFKCFSVPAITLLVAYSIHIRYLLSAHEGTHYGQNGHQPDCQEDIIEHLSNFIINISPFASLAH